MSDAPKISAIDRLRSAMTLPAKTNLLKLAEQNVAKIRADKAEIDARLSAAILERRETNSPITDKHVAAISAELEAADEPYRAALRNRAERREGFEVTAMESLAGPVAEYRATISRLVDELEEVVEIGIALQASAAANGLKSHRIVEASPPLAARIRDLRRIMNGV